MIEQGSAVGMLHTRLVDLLGIEHPIIQAGMGTFGSGAALAAAVSDAGAIGTIGAAKRSADDLRDELRALHEMTGAPFIVNFTRTWLELHPECLDIALAAGPRAVSISAGLPGKIVGRIHDHGALVMAQVHSPDGARLAADEGADIVIAQGAEAGGFGARITSLVLVPQVVDAVAPLPVVASGGIGDGRALAAVLILGAAGANIGTRFLATVEAAIGDDWKQRLVDARSDRPIAIDPRADPADPAAGSDGHGPVTPGAALGPEVPVAGQVAGSIRNVLSAAEVVHGIVRGAEESLIHAQGALLVAV
jgi:enoyl-[acyl-carrier protein] reductase II